VSKFLFIYLFIPRFHVAKTEYSHYLLKYSPSFTGQEILLFEKRKKIKIKSLLENFNIFLKII
jgi:hypothetical protein